jgi:hypothetical protein
MRVLQSLYLSDVSEDYVVGYLTTICRLQKLFRFDFCARGITAQCHALQLTEERVATNTSNLVSFKLLYFTIVLLLGFL